MEKGLQWLSTKKINFSKKNILGFGNFKLLNPGLSENPSIGKRRHAHAISFVNFAHFQYCLR